MFWRFKMKMVKSLLLGGTAGLLAVAGAQAADLPVKARAVQYVKICSLYGAGFYYVPGTDTCIKIGGWVRTYTTYGTNGNSTNGGLVDNVNTRATSNFEWRARGYITADAREQTEYGTVRGYLAVGTNSEYAGGPAGIGGTNTFNSNRAFIQWAGFTVGVAQSFFDFYSGPATSYYGGHINPSEDTGDAGAMVWGYTAQFGGGLSATIAAEAPRTLGVWNGTTTALATTGTAYSTSGQGGVNAPDVVANLRIDQAWGSAQIMGAVHEVNGLYYGTPDTSGGPGDKLGWAVGAGIKLNAPMIGRGDYLQAEVNYAQGASGYVQAGSNARYAHWDSDTSYGTGALFDAIYGTGTDLQLTTAWGVNAAYEHFWNPEWRTSVYGGYQNFKQNAAGNLLVCGAAGVAAAACGGNAGNWGTWNIGSRTQWNVTKNFYLGVDVVYEHLDTMFSDTAVAVGATGARPAIAAGSLADQNVWMVNFRVHRDFYP
jgi:hypothetical protein